MFEGFSPETFDFLWGIRMNNDREWFTEHKQDYINTLYQPMKALGNDLFRLVADKPGNLLKVSRIYRDARLHHPQPYKESLWICIRRDVEWWAENPCLFFEIRPEGVSYGFLLWQPRPAAMQALRADWAAHPGKILRLLSQTQAQTGIPVTADLYKKPKPAPCKELESLYAWRGHIRCIAEEAVSPALFGRELGQRAADFLQKAMPLYEYFNRFSV